MFCLNGKTVHPICLSELGTDCANRYIVLYMPHTKKYAHVCGRISFVVRMTGLEPAQPCDHKILNLARLPIPPHPHGSCYSIITSAYLSRFFVR